MRPQKPVPKAGHMDVSLSEAAASRLERTSSEGGGEGNPLATLPLFVVALVIHLLIVLPSATGPVFGADEMGYFANARYIAGIEPLPTFVRSQFYHPGYSFFIAPLYLLLSDPGHIYMATIVLNCVASSVILFPLAHLGRRLLGLSGRASRWLAFIATLYPGTLLVSHFGFADNLFPAFFLLLIVLAVRAAQNPSLSTLCGLGASSILLYFLHPRAISLVVLVAVYLVLLALSGRAALRPVGLAMALTAVGYLVVADFNHALIEALYPISGDRVERVFARLSANFERILLVAPIGGGQLWYLTVSSLGLVPLGILELWRKLRGSGWRLRLNWPTSPEAFGFLFLLASTAALFATSVLFMTSGLLTTSGPGRIDHYLYGRYNDGFASLFIMLGLAAVIGGLPWIRVIAVAAMVLVSWALVDVGTPLGEAISSGGALCPPCVAGLAPFLSYDRLPHLAVVSLGLIALLFAVKTLHKLRFARTAILGVLAALFVGGSWIGITEVFHPFRTSFTSSTTLQNGIEAIGPPQTISYDLDAVDRYGIRTYQFWQYRTEFALYNGATERPSTELFITSKRWPNPLNARLVAAEQDLDQALWVLPGPRHDELDRRGFLAPTEICGEMPHNGYEAELSVIDSPSGPLVLAPGESETLTISILNSGNGSPWLPIGSLSADCAPQGVVRLGARWSPPDDPGAFFAAQLAELDKTVAPGDQLEIPLTITASATGESLEPGPYLLRISLVHEDITWFDEKNPASRLEMSIVVVDE